MTTHRDTTAACQSLGRELRGIREGRGLSDRDLATQAGVVTSTVAAVEAGWDGIPISTVMRIAVALSCTLTVTPDGATVTPLGDRLGRKPHTWSLYDPEPEGVTRVRDRDGRVWKRFENFHTNGDDVWTMADGSICDWKWIRAAHGPLTEVTPDAPVTGDGGAA